MVAEDLAMEKVSSVKEKEGTIGEEDGDREIHCHS